MFQIEQKGIPNGNGLPQHGDTIWREQETDCAPVVAKRPGRSLFFACREG